MSFKVTIINYFHKLIVYIVRVICVLIHGRHGERMPPIKNSILMESATSLAEKIRTQKLTSVEVMKAFIARIGEVNSTLNCVVDDRCEDALKEAEEADKLIATGEFDEKDLARDKPFLGVPISTKDCISVKGLLWTSGLVSRQHIRGEVDSDVIALMRKAGAIPFALTNVSECCMWWESHNRVHGRTSNPYDTNRIVGGSSGGEGCLQACGASPFGIGSDIGGSIRIPSFFNGIFGHKPSKYIVSNDFQYPAAEDEQTAYLTTGPMSRYATDLKPMLQVLADKNAAKLNLDEPVDLKKIVFFYQECDGGGELITEVDRDIKHALARVVRHLRNNIKAEVKKVDIRALKKSSPIWMANMRTKNYINVDVKLLNMEGTLNIWLELLKSIFGQSNHTFIALLTCLAERFGTPYGSPEHAKLVEVKNNLFEEFDDMLGTDGVFLYPTHPTVAPYHNEPIFRTFNFSYTAIFNTLGLPATAIPLGLGSEGVPLGIQAVSGLNQDRLSLAVACELERAFGGWVPPPVET